MSIAYDGEFDIATGNSRFEQHWKNRKTTWSKFVKRLSKPLFPHQETHAQFLALPRQRQDEMKDMGGFVAGYLTGGVRKPEHVLHRQLITLDIDTGPFDIWEDITLLLNNACLIYSTRKHSIKTPRYRLILPIDREVNREEYQAIARYVAGMFDIEIFDRTTFQPERLMYWQSTCAGEEYVFQVQDGPWIVADDILSKYTDWTDASEWPISIKESEAKRSGIKKQEDPLGKPGLVGAFCRTYSISEAITAYLTDHYDATDKDDRYTFKGGSTAGGLVVYENKFAYSHHGTDPVNVGGHICNAFDLVRIHLYGDRDDSVHEKVAANKMPSYLAMIELAAKDKAVRKCLNMERLEATKADYDDGYSFAEKESGENDLKEESATKEPVNNDWLEQLETDKKGNNQATIDNFLLILRNDPLLKGRFGYDEFKGRPAVLKSLPWRGKLECRYVRDSDIAALRHYIEKRYKIAVSSKLDDAFAVLMIETAFHPVRDYLNGIVWDGKRRLDELFIQFMGCEDSEYSRAITRKCFTAGVARVMEPGCKFDYMVVLVGKQGKQKSKLLKKMGREWFSDSLVTMQGKEAFEQLQGAWLIEVAELAGMRKAEIETIKHFISKQEDSYRAAYGRISEDRPRQCFFIGTTNEEEGFLKDSTGGRRFWPLRIYFTQPRKDVEKQLTKTVIDQLWSEAVHYYKEGELLYLSEELEAEASLIQAEHMQKDDRLPVLMDYLKVKLPENWEELGLYERREFIQTNMNKDPEAIKGIVERNRVCVQEIWCELFGNKAADMTTHATKPIHDMLKALEGWEATKHKARFKGYGMCRQYIKSLKSTRD